MRVLVGNQSWLDAAAQFVNESAELLGPRPVWLFSVGMPGALRGPLRRMGAREAPVILRRSVPADLPYRSHRLFSGVIRASHLPLGGRIRFRLMGSRYGDCRDWGAIDAWAVEIARELLDA
ncbi:flavodoxin [Streptomyces ferrugineus]|uniref:Flavodoxin n=1 Tax=Streptomyces ferrugineus TaxID=1413221 RepID=A0A7M2SE15_9ACTN|nr:flavodoxin [Streptomyces ferrugineus]QOV33728.1 flavodoxin [Streptomyces ferrugineus]